MSRMVIMRHLTSLTILALTLLPLRSDATDSPKGRSTHHKTARNVESRLAERLAGAWYVGGDSEKRCMISRGPKGLLATNETGDKSKLLARDPRHLLAEDWAGGIYGKLQEQAILWRNG